PLFRSRNDMIVAGAVRRGESDGVCDFNVFQRAEERIAMARDRHWRSRNVAGAEAENVVGVAFHDHHGQVQSRHFKPAEQIAFLEFSAKRRGRHADRHRLIKFLFQFGLPEMGLDHKKSIQTQTQQTDEKQNSCEHYLYGCGFRLAVWAGAGSSITTSLPFAVTATITLSLFMLDAIT